MPSSPPPRGPKEPQRIAKLLARAGIASRREVERMIAEGRVALNGTALDTPATLLASLHGVTVDGQPVAAPAPARLFLYHKPVGLLVTERDPAGRTTIYDRLPKDMPRVVPVGRLDLNTEGLLLLTTDGELKRHLELPASGVERTYRARAYGEVSQAQLEDLIHGVQIEGVRYGSINANLERRTGANTWIEMTLTEGKNREVRRVLEHLGLRVSRLIRLRYGPFVLADLPPGEVGEVRQHDLVAFRKALGLPPAARRFEPVTPVPREKPRPASEPDKPRRIGDRAPSSRASAGSGAPALVGAPGRPGAPPARNPAPARATRGSASEPRPSPSPTGGSGRPAHPRASDDQKQARRGVGDGAQPKRTPGKLVGRKAKAGGDAAPANLARAARAKRFREGLDPTPKQPGGTPRPRRPRP